MRKILINIVCCLLVSVGAFAGDRVLVGDTSSLNAALESAQPGQTIVMKNGTWSNVEIEFYATGKEDKLITLTAEEPGKVILSGQSNLTLAGEYLVVSGLVFKDGYSPTGSVISFRKSKTSYANHSRVTGVVIDSFNKPSRTETDIWIQMYGKHNQFDHNHIIGKMNKGVTMAVRLDTEQSQDNHHRIEYNYFGPRPVFGSNGGETLRVGTSHYSLSASRTVIENNIFDECDGEVETISIKSGENIIRSNFFRKSSGTLTLRHGNGNVVENNVFLGEGKVHTGGIRVINADHTIRNNYLSGLTGYRFGGGFVVMNGVPNSTINRYHQVKNVVIENNTLVNVENIQFATGSDAERSAVPVDTSMKNNLIVSTKSEADPVAVYDDISGIAFADNGVVGLKSAVFPASKKIDLAKTQEGLLYDAAGEFGAAKTLAPIAMDQVGVSWYKKGDLRPRLDSGKKIAVKPGHKALVNAVKQASAGDTLVLAPGAYSADRVLKVAFPLTLEAKVSSSMPTITFNGDALFQIEDGGSLKLTNLIFDGRNADDSAGNSLVRTTPSLNSYSLFMDGVVVKTLTVNHSFSVLNASKSSMADVVSIKNSKFMDITGDLFRLDAETDDLGIFNADYLQIENSQFKDIQGAIAKVYRGGTDESTFGPHVIIKNNQFDNVGFGKKNVSGASFALEGVQVVEVEGNKFNQAKPFVANSKVGDPVYTMSDNDWGDAAPQITYKQKPVSIK